MSAASLVWCGVVVCVVWCVWWLVVRCWGNGAPEPDVITASRGITYTQLDFIRTALHCNTLDCSVQDGSRSNSSSRMRAKAASSRSTPASPSRGGAREPQCTCSHPEPLPGQGGKGRQPGQPHPEHRMRGEAVLLTLQHNSVLL